MFELNDFRQLSMDELDLVLGSGANNVSASGAGDDQPSNSNANALDLRSHNGGAEGAGGQGGDQHHGSGFDDGAGGAGGGQSQPAMEPYPSPPAPTSAGESLFQNWVGRTISAGESFIRDGSQLLSIPIITDVVFPPKPQA
jgi:hypothetical protein